MYKYQLKIFFCCQVFHGLSKLKTADVCHGNSFKKSDTEIACETNKNYADPLKYRIVCIHLALSLIRIPKY